MKNKENRVSMNPDFINSVLEELKERGIQLRYKEGTIKFTHFEHFPWCKYVNRIGHYSDGSKKKAGIFISPEFSNLPRASIISAAHESRDIGADVLIVCAAGFSMDAIGFDQLGEMPVIKVMV